ncbi:hypothetical protein PIB30_010638 [Stylosanthes scabra]|uniref:Protein kinase domain-containing protein n=1 Tax=Stylosanthes scabra TaxID=79078 RepID=A0ABU6V724_9FABA|nr:hypothetical protein [Stylosanthes scabra]
MSNITLMLLILCFSAFLYDASALNSDGATLLSLLTHWTFVPPIINSTWNASHSVPCSWHGVQCSHAYHVKSLNLTDLGIHGQLGPEIGQLYRLKILVLSNNGFSGKVPSELSNCSLLELLDLSNNMFNWELPLEMENLKNLKNISLFSNQFSGVIPQNLGINSSLVKLDFTNNKFTGKLPPNLCFRKRLRVLNMGSNQLHGSIPSDLGRCPTLVMLILSENNFTGSLPVFESNVNLKYLHISKNKISGPIPPSLENFTNLAAINMSINNFTGLIPSALGKLVNLTILDLSHNNLEGPLPPQLSNCTKMDHFDVGFNSLNGSFPPSLRNWTEITTLVLRDNHFTGGIPGFFSEFSKLRELQLGGNLIGGAIPPSLGKLKNLFYGLNLSSNGLTGVIPIELGYLQELQSLDLSLNKLTGNIHALDNLLSLIEINVSYNFFSGPLPEGLFKFLSFSPSSFLGNHDLCANCSMNCSNTSHLKQCRLDKKKNHSGFSTIEIVMIMLSSSIFVSALLLVYFHCRSRQEKWYDIQSEVPRAEITVLEREPAIRANHILEKKLKTYTKKELSCIHDIVMEATENLNHRYIIGQGAHGVVYKVQHPNLTCAAKKIAFGGKNEKRFITMRTEIETLKLIRHRNLVEYKACLLAENYGLILCDYMENGCLHDILHGMNPSLWPLKWDLRLAIACGIAKGLRYLHHDCNPPIVHRDIKPKNILLDATLEPHIADFGIAFVRNLGQHKVSAYLKGTIGYIAPECAYSVVPSTKWDVYSYGVVLLELITRKKAVIQDEEDNATGLVSWVRSIWVETNRIDEIVDSELVRAFPYSAELAKQVMELFLLALSCTERDPRNRPTMKDVIVGLFQKGMLRWSCKPVLLDDPVSVVH